MSKTSTKGLMGEAGIQRVMNWWFPDFEDTGIGVTRSRSQGANDVGDLSGIPYVCIECKNHTNPVLASLTDNAQWKAENSGRPVWFLTYKRQGYGIGRSQSWNAVTTLDGFMNGFNPTIPSEDGPVPAFTLDEVPELCGNFANRDNVTLSSVYPGFEHSPLPWKVDVMFRPYVKNYDTQRQAEFNEHGFDESKRTLPLIVHPRTGVEPGKWYVWTRVMTMALMLETIGLLPFDPDFYPEGHVQNLKNKGILQSHRNLIRGYQF